MTRAFTRKSHPDMGAPLPNAPDLPTGAPPADLGTAALGRVRDRLTALERQLQSIAPDAPGAREERAALDAEIRDLHRRLAGGTPDAPPT